MSAWTELGLTSFAQAFIEQSRPQLTALARDHYHREGRGLIAVSLRGPMPSTPDMRAIQIGYRPLEEYRRRTTSATGPMRAKVNATIEKILTYDPVTTALVAVVAGPAFLTVVLTMPLLDARVITAETSGVH